MNRTHQGWGARFAEPGEAGTHIKTAIVLGSDQNYFWHLRGAIQSILDHRPDDRIDICVLDLGLAREQRCEIESFARHVVDGHWDFDFPGQQAAPRWFQAMTDRPFLRDSFPGYDLYIWMDCDAWLQSWEAIELLIDGANEANLALVPEIHPAYEYLYGTGNVVECMNQSYTSAYGPEVARQMWRRPNFNAGLLAARTDSPIWKAYGNLLKAGFMHPFTKWTEQCAMNLAIYGQSIIAKPLPAICNWICCYALPVLDRQGKQFCDPMYPRDRLSVVHVANEKAMSFPIRTTTGDVMQLPLRYLDFKSAMERL